MKTCLVLGASLVLSAPVLAAPLASQQAILQVLKTIDDRQRNSGDYKSLAYLEQKEKDKTDIAREALIYRRDEDEKLMILFTKPKGEAGKGYIRLDKNLWSYDPGTGKWDRRTERERIAGTDSRRADFDQSKLVEEYDATYTGEGKLGQFDIWQLELKVKPNTDVAFPVVKLWVDQASGNVLKRQEFALSGRLMRTLYYPRWQKLYSESKKADVWYPGEIRIYDEVEKENSTIVVMKSVDLRPLEANIFTKAWLEAKSR
ncbi:MAG: outer membrane lipoprotein-sorting protein [Myxococcaceae bacterium]